jgi:hypothetical protein
MTVLQLPGNKSSFLLDASLLCYATNKPQLWSLSLPSMLFFFSPFEEELSKQNARL